MATRTTGIEWTDHTLNPFVGCSQVSPGCDNCYAIPIARRNGDALKMAQYVGTTRKTSAGKYVWTGKVAYAPNALKRLAVLKKPALVFVNSMSDFWHENATTEMRRLVLAEMRKYPHLGFQVLTKRPENILPMVEELGEPLPENFWLGATVEDQKRADLRVPKLRAVPAAIRFLSIEPMIGPVRFKPSDLQGIHWAIVGGESGHHARPMKAEWVLDVIADLREAGVPVFFKQWGKPQNNPLWDHPDAVNRPAYVEAMDPVGKGGSLIHGESVKEFPATWRHGVSPANKELPLASPELPL
jgi:protein gp37